MLLAFYSVCMSVVLCEGLCVNVWEGAYKQYTYICNTYLVLLMESGGHFSGLCNAASRLTELHKIDMCSKSPTLPPEDR